MARLRPYLPLFLIALAALAIRIGAIYELRPTCAGENGPKGITGECWPLFGDTDYVTIQARHLSQGEGFVDASAVAFKGEIRPGAAHPPMFTVFIAALDKLGFDSVGWWRASTALTGSIGVFLIGLVGWRLGGDRERTTGPRSRAIGIVAAGIAAINPWMWSRDADLLVESLVIPLIALMLLAALRLWRRPSWASAAVLGFVIGALWLTRAELILLLPCMIPLYWGLRSESFRKRVGLLALTGVIAAAMMAPWVLYNVGRFQNRVFISTNLGMAEMLGSCDATYYGEHFGYWTFDCVNPVDTSQVRDDSEAERMLTTAARGYVGDHTGRAPVAAIARVGRFWGLYSPFDTVGRWDRQEGMGTFVARTGWVTLLVLAPLAIVGAWQLRRRRVPISPFVAPVAVATFAAFLLIPIPRFRVAADVVIVILAATAIDFLWRRLRGHDVAETPADARSDPPDDQPVDESGPEAEDRGERPRVEANTGASSNEPATRAVDDPSP